MDVPLIVKPIVKYNKEKFEIWKNGQRKIISSPILPYYYSYDSDLDVPYVKKTKVRAKALSSYQDKVFYKYEFNTREELSKHRIEGVTFEDNIPFIIRNRIDNPEVFKKYKNTNELKFLYLDIEQYCKPDEPFPTYDDRIISISWATNDRHIYCAYLKKDTTSDKKLLQIFIEQYQKIQPDVVVLYNKTYDLPTIIRRCERNKIDTSVFSRTNIKPTLATGNIPFIDGVVVYDVYDSARDDQYLTGNVANRGLKEVSNYYGYKEKRKPLDTKNISKYIGTKELVEYNKEDVERTMYLFDIYWTNIEFNANDLGLPISEVVDLNISNLGLVVLGDAFREQNIISDGKNADRYPEIFNRKKEKGESNYQGAIIDIFKTGRFEPVFKADYGSMYPTIMAEFNLSPDTTTLLRYDEYSNKFHIEKEDIWTTYYIPDKEMKKTMVIQVENKKKGFSAELVKRFLDERAKYKKRWKEHNVKSDRALSDNRKVKANGGVYGNQGYSNHPYGFAPAAVATTGIGRECAQLLIDLLEELYPESCIEVDTDGVYFSTDNVNEQQIQTEFRKRLKERFHKDLNLSIDVDEYPAGYFYKAKNYVLRDKSGGIIYHGVAMKGRNKSLLKKSLINKIAEAKLSKKPIQPIIDEYLKLDFPLQYFAMNITLGRYMSMYKNEGSLGPTLANRAQEELRIKPEIGNTYYYVKTKKGYELLDLARRDMIDEDYYQTEVQKVVDIFKTEVISQKVDKWF